MLPDPREVVRRGVRSSSASAARGDGQLRLKEKCLGRRSERNPSKSSDRSAPDPDVDESFPSMEDRRGPGVQEGRDIRSL